MVDTVVIRVRNLARNYDFYRAVIANTEKIYGQTLLEYNIVDATQKPKQLFRKVEIDGKVFLSMDKRDLYVPSSHYQVATLVKQDYIEFNMSVPKYLFGNNISQFVMSRFHPGFSYQYHSEMRNQVDLIYDKLLKFIKKFFEDNFEKQYLIEVNYDDVTIERIDLCFNQIFDTKEQAFTYLDYVKRFQKPNERLKTNRMRDFKTGISYQGEGYLFKIYHKGEEYRKFDKKKHKRINRVLEKDPSRLTKVEGELFAKVVALNGNKKRVDIATMEDIADRILRYEVTFKKLYLSYIYKKVGLASRDPQFELNRKRWLKLENRRLRKNGREFDAEELKFYNEFRRIMRRNHDFYPFPPQYVRTKERLLAWHKNMDYTEAHFSKDLFRALAKILFKYVDHYYIKEQETEATVVQRIRDHNEIVRKKRSIYKLPLDSPDEKRRKTGKLISESKILMYLGMIQKYGSLDMWCEKVGLNSRRKRYIRKELESLDVRGKSVREPLNFFVSRDYKRNYDLEFKYAEVMRYTNRKYFER